MLQKGDAGTDVDGMVEVVTGEEDGGSGTLVVLLKEMLDETLTAGVEEIEGLVQYQQLGLHGQGGYDADLLLVTG